MGSKIGTDYLQVVVLLNIAASVVLIVTALILLRQNTASRNLMLGTGAVVGAVAAFLIQMKFDLRSTTRNHHISFAYTFDLAEKNLRQWDYTKLDGIEMIAGRVSTEVEAGKWIFTDQPALLETDRRKVASDLALFSTMAFFGHLERDWQWSYKKYNSPALGFSRIIPLSKPSECSKVGEEELRSKLRSAGNVFANVPVSLTMNDVCLPPGTIVQVSPTALVLRNPVFQIVLEIEDPGGVNFVQPDGNAEVPKLPDGRPRFENHLRGLNIEITFLALRAYHPHRERYEEWSKRLVERLTRWYACC
jgi:hypothetical protein